MRKNKNVLSDKNVVELLLLVYDNERITSSMMSIVNSNYSYVKDAADMLCRAGFLDRYDDWESNKIYWELTEKGIEAASHLKSAEILLSELKETQKYYK